MDAVHPELIDVAEASLAAQPSVVGVRSVRMRWMGHRLRADAELDIESNVGLQQAHQIAHAAEHELTHVIPKLTTAMVHAYPAHNDKEQRHGAPPQHAH